MPEGLDALKAAAGEYRRAVEALGATWPEPDPVHVAPPPRVAEYYGIDEVPEELIWVHSFIRAGYGLREELPTGGFLLPWPATADEALGVLEHAWPMPFPWRNQIPVFHFEWLVFTLVVDEAHAGEVWRYELGEDAHDVVRAAPSLAAVFASWAQVAARDGFVRGEYDGWLQLRSDMSGDEEYLRDMLQVDPFTYPLSLLDDDATRQRQRECGVDVDQIDDHDAWRATAAEVAATVKRLDNQ